MLQPCAETLRRKISEVTSGGTRSIAGAGSEQDYWARFFASKPWRALNVIGVTRSLCLGGTAVAASAENLRRASPAPQMDLTEEAN